MCRWTLLWKGEPTEELKELYEQYAEMFHGFYPGSYEEIAYEGLSYEKYVGYIKESLKQKIELPEIMYPGINDDDDEIY